jgi:hypothetical protein
MFENKFKQLKQQNKVLFNQALEQHLDQAKVTREISPINNEGLSESGGLVKP